MKRKLESVLVPLALVVVLATGCSKSSPAPATPAPKAEPAYYHVDPATAATLDGTVHFTGAKPKLQPIDMSEDPACVQAHHGKAYDESIEVGTKNALGNVFVYVEKGLEGKEFETPTSPVVIDQAGCWFVPRILGIQTGQVLKVINSDPVTHNIHPQATTNREWNHSQGPGDPPIERRFSKPEVMIPVKCNIHGWMRAYVGVLSHPYFAVSNATGTFKIPNLPPGTYTIAAWQEKLGTQRQTITVEPGQKATLDFTFK